MPVPPTENVRGAGYGAAIILCAPTLFLDSPTFIGDIRSFEQLARRDNRLVFGPSQSINAHDNLSSFTTKCHIKI